MPENNDNFFWALRLCGERFNKHGIPLDILKDFYALNELIKGMAKTRYKWDNPHKRKVPRNFLDDISLQIVDVKEGSAVAIISMICLNGGLLFDYAHPIGIKYLKEARDCILRTVAAAAEGQAIQGGEYMTSHELVEFNRFGC